MLSDHDIQLLTAFVDGELSQRQRKAVVRLLEKSSEARAMLKQLQENAHKVKKLPYHKVEPSLVDAVMQAIAEQQSQPRPVAPRRRAWLPYVAATMAASLLICAVALVYWKTVLDTPVGPRDPANDIVKNGGNEKKLDSIPNPVTPPRKKDNPNLALATAIIEGAVRDSSNYVPPKPYVVNFGELTKAESKSSAEFAHKLNKANSVFLEITVKSNDVAMTRLREVLMERQIKLTSDPAVNKALQAKNAGKTEFLVYAENLTTDDVTKLMRELSHQYVVGQGMNQKMVDSPYKKISLAPSEIEDLQSVAKLLGVEVSAVELKNHVAKNAKRDVRAVVLPANGGNSPAPEVRQFLQQRPAPQAGTLQVIIKIRQE